MDAEIKSFVESVGAKEPSPGTEKYATWRQIFKRENYFTINGTFMIVKISRRKKSFWGVGKDYIDLFNSMENYYLVLLVSEAEGWVFDKTEINSYISHQRWNLRSSENQYKINVPLADKNRFFGPKGFLKKVGVSRSGSAT